MWIVILVFVLTVLMPGIIRSSWHFPTAYDINREGDYIVSRMHQRRWSECCGGQGHLCLRSPGGPQSVSQSVSDQLWCLFNLLHIKPLNFVDTTNGLYFLRAYLSASTPFWGDYRHRNLTEDGRSTVTQHGWGIWCYRTGHRTHSKYPVKVTLNEYEHNQKHSEIQIMRMDARIVSS